MKINFDALYNRMNEDSKSANSNSGNKLPYPVVYPHADGKLTFKILYNCKNEIVQRIIKRHENGKEKIACLETYGLDCPACKAIKEMTDLLGKDAGIWRKFPTKERGFCFAILKDIPDTYYDANSKDAPKVGDIVILMYPKSVYTDIANVIADAGKTEGSDVFTGIMAKNMGFLITLDRKRGTNNIPKYEVKLSLREKKCIDTGDDAADDAKFDEILSNLPALNDIILPVSPTEEIHNGAKALADTVRQFYANGAVVQPNGANINIEKDNNMISGNIVATTGSVSKTVKQPDCYGNHDGSSKCDSCPFETECFNAS